MNDSILLTPVLLPLVAGLLVALAHRPELLVLDEPTSNLDPRSRRELHHLLRQIPASADPSGSDAAKSGCDSAKIASSRTSKRAISSRARRAARISSVCVVAVIS